MAIVNFAIEGSLDVRMRRTLKERGFSSRAEYIRSRVIDDLDQWEAMTRSMPHYYLKGKAALALDKESDDALAEYRAGKAIIIKSLADLD